MKGLKTLVYCWVGTLQKHLRLDTKPDSDVAVIRSRLLAETLRLPNLRPICSDRPIEISSHYEQLKQTVEERLDEWITNPNVRANARETDLAYFSATWYPDASLDRLETMSWYTIWIFIWDDGVEDTATSGSEERIDLKALHQQALRYIEFHLGWSSSETEPAPPTKYCSLFKHAAEPLRAGCSVTERQRLYQHLVRYMECSEIEHRFAHAGTIPTVDEYWGHRLGTSSIDTNSALAEYMAGGHIPKHLFDADELKTMWLETNRHIVVLNDLLSLRKEMRTSLHNLVPVILQETGATLEGVVESLLHTLRVSKDRLEEASQKLLDMAEVNAAARNAVEQYVSCFRTNVAGNYWWSLRCDRYGIAKDIQGDGSLVIRLGEGASVLEGEAATLTA